MARTSQEDLDKLSFGKAFNTRRDELGGSGKVFTWRGNRYTTDLAEEAPRRRGRTGPATENAPERSSRPQRRPSMAPEESPRPTARRSKESVQRDPQDASPTTRARPPVQRDAQDASPTTRARPPVRRDTQDASPTTSARTSTVRAAEDMPPSVRRAIFMASTPQETQAATRIAQEGMDRRMPLRNIIQQIRESIGSRRQNATGDRATSRSQAAADAARARTEAAEEARARRAAGMAKGGMAKKQGYNLGGTVKKGDTDRRNTGMFYDSKSPRGYK